MPLPFGSTLIPKIYSYPLEIPLDPSHYSTPGMSFSFEPTLIPQIYSDPLLIPSDANLDYYLNSEVPPPFKPLLIPKIYSDPLLIPLNLNSNLQPITPPATTVINN